MHVSRAGAVALLLVVACAAGAWGACGERGPDPAIPETVSRWLDAWTRAAGPARDDAAATAARRELGGALLVRTDEARTAGAGEPRARSLARLYGDLVGLAIPPDRGFEVIAVERDGESARVSVRLRYSEAAAGVAAAAGLIRFDQVAPLNGLVRRPPQPVFTVTRVDGRWRITAIRAG